MSRTLMVCAQVAALPHWSTALQVRMMVLVPPQPFVTASVNVIVTVPQASVAVATPVLLVLVSAGQSSVRLGGHVITGGVVSRTVMVCKQVDLLPQSSVAVQVRRIVEVPPHWFVTESL
jgi:hypothetical protein